MPPEILYILGGALLASFVVGAAGFGDGIMAAAIWLHVLLPVEAVPLILAIGILIHGTNLYKLWGQLDFRHLKSFLIPGIIGVPFGVYLLQHAPPDLFKLGMGIFLIAYSLFMLFSPKTVIKCGGSGVDAVFGGTGGVVCGFAGLTGIIPAIWCGLRNWPKEQQRGVFQPFFVVLDIIALGLLAWGGMVTRDTGINLLWCVPAIIIGTWVGLKVYRHINDQTFKKVVLVLIFLSGVMLVV